MQPHNRVDPIEHPRGVTHLFQPYVMVTEHPNGRYSIRVDWGGSYTNTVDEATGDETAHGDETEASNLLDRRLRRGRRLRRWWA